MCQSDGGGPHIIEYMEEHDRIANGRVSDSIVLECWNVVIMCCD